MKVDNSNISIIRLLGANTVNDRLVKIKRADGDQLDQNYNLIRDESSALVDPYPNSFETSGRLMGQLQGSPVWDSSHPNPKSQARLEACQSDN